MVILAVHVAKYQIFILALEWNFVFELYLAPNLMENAALNVWLITLTVWKLWLTSHLCHYSYHFKHPSRTLLFREEQTSLIRNHSNRLDTTLKVLLSVSEQLQFLFTIASLESSYFHACWSLNRHVVSHTHTFCLLISSSIWLSLYFAWLNINWSPLLPPVLSLVCMELRGGREELRGCYFLSEVGIFSPKLRNQLVVFVPFSWVTNWVKIWFYMLKWIWDWYALTS